MKKLLGFILLAALLTSCTQTEQTQEVQETEQMSAHTQQSILIIEENLKKNFNKPIWVINFERTQNIAENLK